MSELVHPASLNAFQQYRQACSILSHTSRAVLPAWYQEALELDFQLHIRIDGTSVRTFFLNRSANEWSKSEPLTEEDISDPEKAMAFAERLMSGVLSLKGKSLGVVLHIADEFATAELKQELENPAALPDLRDTAINNPGEVLDDSSVSPEQASWRVLPYPAAGSEVIGTTITVSKRLADFLSTLRKFGEDKNFPIVTHSLSAPLVAISAIPTVIHPSGERPFVCILQYPWFTVLAFFNQHSDLRLIRTLQHRGMRRPSNFRNALATTNASLEFVDPQIFVMPLAREIDDAFADGLRMDFPDAAVETVTFEGVVSISYETPEPALALLPPPGDGEMASHTFGVLRTEKWFLQDFLPPEKEVIELFPSRKEMLLLRYLKLARIVIAGAALLGMAWYASRIYSMTRRPEWSFDAVQANALQTRTKALNQERKRIDQWNNLLSDRSKAWTSMEALARLFPAKSGLLVKSFNHTARPDNTPGKARVGFIKEWKITGLAREEALPYINSLNSREGISAKFTEITKATGNLAFDPTPNTRSLAVNVKTQENPRFRQMPAEDITDSDESSYGFTFTLNITQRFEATDPFAIAVGKAP